MAKAFRKIADLYEEMANIEENKELNAAEKEALLDDLIGKILVQTLKVEKLK